MEERGKLQYEEEIKARRAQAELGANHIGIIVSFFILILTWTVYGFWVWKGMEMLWLAIGMLVSLLLNLIALYIINRLVTAEFTQNLPVKVYEKGILMPITPFDRLLWRKQAFVHYNNLASIRLIRAHNPGQKDVLIATTMQRRKYPKKYDRNSKETRNILETVHNAFPQAKVEVSE